MLDAKEIDIEIARLEYGESSYPAYAKLADLYIIRNQMNAPSVPDAYDAGFSAAPAEDSAVVGNFGDSDFLQAARGKDCAAVFSVMDELMDTLRVTAPRVYTGVMRKISAL